MIAVSWIHLSTVLVCESITIFGVCAVFFWGLETDETDETDFVYGRFRVCACARVCVEVEFNSQDCQCFLFVVVV